MDSVGVMSSSRGDPLKATKDTSDLDAILALVQSNTEADDCFDEEVLNRVWCETLTQADADSAADTAATSRRSTGTCNSANLYLKNKEEYNSSHLYLNLP